MIFLIIFGFLIILGIILLKLSEEHVELIFIGIPLIVFNAVFFFFHLCNLIVSDVEDSNNLKIQYEAIEYNNIDKNLELNKNSKHMYSNGKIIGIWYEENLKPLDKNISKTNSKQENKK